MRAPRPRSIDIEIDKLTNSIENAVTGESFDTLVSLASAADLRAVTKKAGWLFDWRAEARYPGHTIFKLTIVEDPEDIHGLVSLENQADHVRLHLVESSRLNKGRTKKYVGVPGNLFAYACKMSFEKGHEGNVAFISKTQLIEHYIKSLGAEHFGNHIMLLKTPAARNLIIRYFNETHP